ncbi:membrane hypothetical protein [uncultured Mycobacterium sp.]|uniref:P-type ATPase A domain-containing protein n=1 Tax=uncultured Mycobacterium sp. TaxID=171292 RepID=A0A1Y5PDU8_9MYCO|nr:membrane hypothetical protein [uncultured Mycobacterium sp.]
MDGAAPNNPGIVGQFARWALLAVTLGAFVAGGIAWLLGARTIADVCWIAGTAAAIVPALWWVVSSIRAGRVGVDVLAVLSLGGALAVREYLAGALIGVMLATGQALDAAAQRRATKDLRALLDRVPRTARRRTPDGVEVVGLDDIVVDDIVVVGPGEVLPVDGVVLSDDAVLDDSALTGESALVRCGQGEPLRSGSVNAGSGLELRASASAADSTYAGIVRLARQAAAESAPASCRRADGGSHRRHGGGGVGAGGTHRRPRRRLVPAGRAGRGGPRLDRQRHARSRGGGPGGRHPVPTVARGTRRDRVRTVPHIAHRGTGPWWRRARNTRPCKYFGAGQDGNADNWPSPRN